MNKICIITDSGILNEEERVDALYQAQLLFQADSVYVLINTCLEGIFKDLFLIFF